MPARRYILIKEGPTNPADADYVPAHPYVPPSDLGNKSAERANVQERSWRHTCLNISNESSDKITRNCSLRRAGERGRVAPPVLHRDRMAGSDVGAWMPRRIRGCSRKRSPSPCASAFLRCGRDPCCAVACVHRPPPLFLLNSQPARLGPTVPRPTDAPILLSYFASPFFLESLWNTCVYAVGRGRGDHARMDSGTDRPSVRCAGRDLLPFSAISHSAFRCGF